MLPVKKSDSIDQKVLKYPILVKTEIPPIGQSPAEAKQLAKKLPLDVSDLRRLHHDLYGCD